MPALSWFGVLSRSLALAMAFVCLSAIDAAAQSARMRYDRLLLEKLHAGRLSEIPKTDTAKLELFTVIKAFSEGCELSTADTSRLRQYEKHLITGNEQGMAAIFYRVHPLFLDTANAILSGGGCDKPWAVTTFRNLSRLLESWLTESQPQTTGVLVAHIPFPAAFRALAKMRMDEWWSHVEDLEQSVSAIPPETKVLRCWYVAPGSTPYINWYWYQRRPAALTPALESKLSRDHPVFSFGPPTEECPANGDPGMHR